MSESSPGSDSVSPDDRRPRTKPRVGPSPEKATDTTEKIPTEHPSVAVPYTTLNVEEDVATTTTTTTTMAGDTTTASADEPRKGTRADRLGSTGDSPPEKVRRPGRTIGFDGDEFVEPYVIAEEDEDDDGDPNLPEDATTAEEFTTAKINSSFSAGQSYARRDTPKRFDKPQPRRRVNDPIPPRDETEIPHAERFGAIDRDKANEINTAIETYLDSGKDDYLSALELLRQYLTAFGQVMTSVHGSAVGEAPTSGRPMVLGHFMTQGIGLDPANFAAIITHTDLTRRPRSACWNLVYSVSGKDETWWSEELIIWNLVPFEGHASAAGDVTAARGYPLITKEMKNDPHFLRNLDALVLSVIRSIKPAALVTFGSAARGFVARHAASIGELGSVVHTESPHMCYFTWRGIGRIKAHDTSNFVAAIATLRGWSLEKSSAVHAEFVATLRSQRLFFDAGSTFSPETQEERKARKTVERRQHGQTVNLAHRFNWTNGRIANVRASLADELIDFRSAFNWTVGKHEIERHERERETVDENHRFAWLRGNVETERHERERETVDENHRFVWLRGRGLKASDLLLRDEPCDYSARRGVVTDELIFLPYCR